MTSPVLDTACVRSTRSHVLHGDGNGALRCPAHGGPWRRWADPPRQRCLSRLGAAPRRGSSRRSSGHLMLSCCCPLRLQSVVRVVSRIPVGRWPCPLRQVTPVSRRIAEAWMPFSPRTCVAALGDPATVLRVNGETHSALHLTLCLSGHHGVFLVLRA